MTLHEIRTLTTARYGVLGEASGPVDEVWMALHGYGQLARYFGRHLQAVARPGRRILVPEAPSRFYLDDRYERIGATWATRAMRDADIVNAVAYLDDVLVAATAPDGVDLRAVPLVGLGFSQGAGMVARWIDRSPVLARRPVRAQRLILWGGGMPPDVDLASPWLRSAHLTLVHGSQDEIVPASRVDEETTRLTRAGVPFRCVSYDGGHRMEATVLAGLSGDP